MLAEEGALTFPQLATPLLVATVATVAAVVLWLLVLLGLAFATRARGVDPGPATMDLGEEPPAVVDLLTKDQRVTPDAVPATLLDLAARDFLDLEQQGPGRTVCRVRRTSAQGLEAYERMVLDHVAGLAVDGVVPAEALTTGPQDQSTRCSGPSSGRWSPTPANGDWPAAAGSTPVKAFLRAAALVPAGLGVLYANAAGGPDFGTIGAGLAIWVVLTSSIKLFGDQRDTPAGAEAAARWLGVRDYLGRNEVFPTPPPASVAIWDRYLGYGAALGVATAALRALPMGSRTTTGPGPRTADAGGSSRSGTRGSASPGVGSPRSRSWSGWLRRPAATWPCGSCWDCAAGPMDTRTTTRRPAGCAPARPSLPPPACWSPPGGRERCCAQSSTWSRGGRSKARWCAGAPTPGERQDRPLHGRRHRALGQDQGVAGPRRRLRPLPGRRAGQGDRRSPAGARLPDRFRPRTRRARRSGDRTRPGTGGDGQGRRARARGAGRPGAPLFQQPPPLGRMRGCRYQAAAGRGSVSVFAAAGDLVRLLVRVNRQFGEPVQDVGDEAFLRGDTIAVIKGDVLVSIRVQGDQVADRVAALRRLGSTAAGRLATTATPSPDGGRAGLHSSPAPPGRSAGPS
jgi:hypothetical protein